jgi:hypothetical protein
MWQRTIWLKNLTIIRCTKNLLTELRTKPEPV